MTKEERKARQRARNRDYYRRNKDKLKEASKRYYEDNREEQKAKRAEYVRSNHDTVLSKQREYGRAYSKTERGRAVARGCRSRRRMQKAKTSERIYVREIWERSSGICYLCREPVELSDAVVEHCVPLSRGGLDVRSNVRPAHRSCNAKKHAKTPLEYWMTG